MPHKYHWAGEEKYELGSPFDITPIEKHGASQSSTLRQASCSLQAGGPHSAGIDVCAHVCRACLALEGCLGATASSCGEISSFGLTTSAQELVPVQQKVNS